MSDEDLRKLENEAKRTGRKIQFCGDGKTRLVEKKLKEKKGLWGSDLMKSRMLRDDLSEIE